MIEAVIFWTFALMAIGGAIGVVLHKSILYSALFLIVTFLSIAGFFVLNNADFLAVAQTIVYVVGLTIVMLFGIMFTGQQAFAPRKRSKTERFAPFVAAGMLLLLLLVVGVASFGQMGPFALGELLPQTAAVLKAQGSTQMLGTLLFSRYVLPFELASVLLLVAMLGAILIAKRELDDDIVETHLRPGYVQTKAAYAEAGTALLTDDATTAMPIDLNATTEPKELIAGGVR
ncbi:MAG: NADH-quinone oxidoreductase subunit J [Vampirovibrionales bacterium]|nr:NADH-quinone oxidoreductase subunit J [Vampirovibrionales bacterium]